VAASDGDTLNNGSMSGTVTMGGAPHSLAAPGAPMASSDGPSSTIRRSSVAAPVECVAGSAAPSPARRLADDGCAATQGVGEWHCKMALVR
jgi:hypothetical protein